MQNGITECYVTKCRGCRYGDYVMTQLVVPFLYLPGGTDRTHDNSCQLNRWPVGQRLEPTSTHYEAADSDAYSGKVNAVV